jgi:single-strand DNA-binding protein
MTADYFHFTIEGNLGTTPQLRHTASGTAVTDLRVAINRSYVNEDGERVKNTNWYKVTAWGRQAETSAQYLTKGRRVRVQVGRVDSETWVTTNPETGATELAHRPVLHASRVDFLPSGTRNDSAFDAGDAGDDAMYAEDMGDAEVEAPAAVVPEPAAKKRAGRGKKANAPVLVPAGFEDFGDFGPNNVPF